MKKYFFPLTIIFLILIFIVGCGGNDKDTTNTNQDTMKKSGDSSLQVYKGVYISGERRRELHICDTGEDLWVVDMSGDLNKRYFELMQTSLLPAYVELQGVIKTVTDSFVPASYKYQFEVTNILKIENFINQINCPDYQLLFKGHGQEQPWQIMITKKEIIFSVGYSKEKTFYPYSDPTINKSNNINYKSMTTDSLRESFISVTIIKSECFDVMSGEKYNFSVQVNKDDKVYFGCGEEFK